MAFGFNYGTGKCRHASTSAQVGERLDCVKDACLLAEKEGAAAAGLNNLLSPEVVANSMDKLKPHNQRENVHVVPSSRKFLRSKGTELF